VALSRLPVRRNRGPKRSRAPDLPVRGRGSPCKYQREWPYYITDREVVGQPLHKVLKINEWHPRCPSMRFKTSTRWIPAYDTACRRVIPIPFVNKVGKFSPHYVCKWRCHPAQAIASLSATVFARLQRVLIKRHGTRFAFSLSNLTFECASAYSVSFNDWIIDRFLGIFSKKTGKRSAFRSLLSAFIAKLDDDQRFVQRHASLQAQWLTSRSKRPRDKSRLKRKPSNSPHGEAEGCACLKGCSYGYLLRSMFPREQGSSATRIHFRKKDAEVEDWWLSFDRNSLLDDL